MKMATSRNLAFVLTRIVLLLLVISALVACGKRSNKGDVTAEPTVIRADETPEASATSGTEEIITDGTPAPLPPDDGGAPDAYPGLELGSPSDVEAYPAP